MRVRGLCVHHRPMVYARDQLSVPYDPVAHDLIGRAIRQARRKQANARVPGWVPFLVESPLVPRPEWAVHDDGPDKLTRYERAFQRALYYDGRIHVLSGGRPRPAARWSLKIEWNPVPLLPGQARRGRLQVFSDTSGSRHVRSGPRRDSWVRNPELRSVPGDRDMAL
jgi:hypothetical protein